jgi:hypothetical protein
MKKQLIILGILILGIALIFGVIYIKQFFQIDSCLDSGGKWNYDTKKCEKYYNLDSIEISKLYWYSDFDKKLNIEFLTKGEMLDSLSKSPNELIEILNRRPSKCKIEYQNLIGDTIIIRIINDEILTEQMGTTGADCFMAETIYTLTENDLIKFVRFEMDFGSHASPGVYSRNDYNKMIK